MNAGRCNGCGHLIYEQWPKGAMVARCMDKSKGKWFGRVVEHSKLGIMAGICCPAWCGERKNTE